MSASYRSLSLLVGSAFFMEQLDATIIAPAIPRIALDLGVSPLSLNLTLTIYLLCAVAFIPTGPFLAGRWGTRTVFRAAVLLFAASSVACAAAPNLAVLALARAAQGVAAAWMVPVGRMVIVHATPRGELVAALAWMITPAMLGPLLGPPLGGWITTTVGWHWIFLVNVPIGLLGWWAAGRVMAQIREAPPGPFDTVAWLLLAGVLAGVIGVIEWARHGLGGGGGVLPLGVMAFGLGALGVAYARRSRRAVHPLLDFALLRTPTFHTSFWAGALVRVGFGALPFLLPLMLQLGFGYTPLESGLVLLASGAVAFATKTRTAAMLRRWGFRQVLVVNGVMCAVGLLGCALLQPAWGLTGIAVVVSLAGFFRSVQFNALAAIAYADLPPSKIGPATTLNTMVQQLAVMLGIAGSALVVELSARHGGRGVAEAFDFAVAFALCAAVAAAALPACLQLGAGSGSELSGHTLPHRHR